MMCSVGDAQDEVRTRQQMQVRRLRVLGDCLARNCKHSWKFSCGGCAWNGLVEE